MSERYSNRVPISVNGTPAEAVVSTGSDIPNCWMSFAYFSRIGFKRSNIIQVPGVEKVVDFTGNEYPVLGVPDRVFNLEIGDCPMTFNVRPFILQFGNGGYTFWNDFQLTAPNLRDWEIIVRSDGITIGVANQHSIRFLRQRPNEPLYLASLRKGRNFDVNQFRTWLSRNQAEMR